MSEHHQDRIQTPPAGGKQQSQSLESAIPARLPHVSPSAPTTPAVKQPNDAGRIARSRSVASISSQPHSSSASSVISSASSSRLKDVVLDVTRRLSAHVDLGSTSRPTVQRDLSHASAISTESTESNVTITPWSPHLGRQSSSLASNFYPNQAFSALHHQKHPPIHVPPPVVPSIKPVLTNPWPPTSPPLDACHPTGTRSWANSPTVIPGLYQQSPVKSVGGTPTHESAYQAPYLHHLHHQIPKETHVADIDVDPISGRKIINNYEIVDELGRGTHGKVKLGRSLTDGRYVAIKIVERFPKKRRLGRLGNAEDKVKREVAILKKARHPHVVALLEVIDDPARRKVYIILERVDLGEIPWRTRGSREIAVIECRRYERESRKHPLTKQVEQDDLAVLKLGRMRRARAAREKFRAAKKLHDSPDGAGGGWSLELNGDPDEESEVDSVSRQSSYADEISEEEMNRIISKPPEKAPLDAPDLLETVRPALSTVRTETQHSPEESWLANLLDGTMYGAATEPVPQTIPEEEEQLTYHQTDMPPLEPVLTQEDADIDVGRLYRDLSHDDLANRAAAILDCDIASDLLFVPCMTFQAARETFRDTLLGLQYLHYQGIIHRDIKPPNLLQTRDHRTKISDFGVSYLGRPMEEEGDDASDAEPNIDEAKELAKNVGTPAFYAPELCISGTSNESAPIGKGIDIWALGVTLFCMIFARVPFVDSEFIVMRRIAEEDVYIPKKRLRPVDTKPQSRNEDNILHYSSNATFRGAHALEYEELDDLLLDLLKRLLTKDVKKRITLDEIRHHPWVLDDLSDKGTWLELSAPSNNAEGKKIEISREDLETSVVPISIIDRIRSGIKKAVGLGRSSSSKRRTPSQDASYSSSASSSAPNVARRRMSLRREEAIVTALKATREPDHPLATGAYLNMAPTSGSKTRLESKSAAQTPNAKLVTPRSGMSTTNSSRTVRQAESSNDEGYFAGSVPASPLVSTSLDSPGSANFGGLLSGAGRLLWSVRDRSSTGRSEDKRSVMSDRSSESGDHVHAEPSIALSTASAAGHSITPRALQDTASMSSRSGSPAVSRNSSIVSTPDLAVRQTGFDHLPSVTGQPSSQNQPPSLPHSQNFGSRLARSLNPEFDRAESEMIRRQVIEGQVTVSPRPVRVAGATPALCPPSPDDEILPHGRTTASPAISTDSVAPSKVPSLETGLTSPTSSVQPSITPVSSADHLRLEASSAMPEPGTMIGLPERTKDKTILAPIIETIGSPPQSSRMKVSSDDEAYHADAAIDSDDYDDSSDDDGGLLMMRRKSVPHQGGRSVSISNAVLARNRERRATGGSTGSKKSSRSGSTKSKVRQADDADEVRGRKLSS